LEQTLGKNSFSAIFPLISAFLCEVSGRLWLAFGHAWHCRFDRLLSKHLSEPSGRAS